jgi:hypothetical protein
MEFKLEAIGKKALDHFDDLLGLHVILGLRRDIEPGRVQPRGSADHLVVLNLVSRLH